MDNSVGCHTVPCFQGKMPDEKEPEVPCAIIRSMCSKSPNEQLEKESKEKPEPAGFIRKE